MEALEARDCPAWLLWTNAGGDHQFDNPLNWDGEGTPEEGDTLVFSYDEGNGTSANCVGMSGSFENIEFHSDYGGTVTFSGPVTTWEMNLHGGTISQAVNADLTIEGSLIWTGGTLNSSTNLEDVIIDGEGATGLIEPADGGTVTLGSKFTLANGAVVTMKEGTINTTNDGVGVTINANCMLIADPGQGKNVTWGGAPGAVVFGNPMLIKTDGWLKVQSGHWPVAKGSLLNEGGSFILEGGASAYFGEKVPGQAAGTNFLQTSGATYIAADASVQVIDTMVMTGGLISIKCGPKPQGFVGNVIAIRSLKITGGDIRYDASLVSDRRVWGEFWVDGNVDWTGGTYHPYVDEELDGDAADLWKVTGGSGRGKFTIGGTAAVEPTTVDGTEPVASGMEWRLFEADDSITSAAGTPSLSAGWSFIKPEITTYWNLKWN